MAVLTKYFIYIDDIGFGLKHHVRLRTCTVGGNKKFIELFESVVRNHFKKELEDCVFKMIQKNKCKYSFRCTLSQFRVGIDSMRKNLITVVQVNDLGRVMR